MTHTTTPDTITHTPNGATALRIEGPVPAIHVNSATIDGARLVPYWLEAEITNAWGEDGPKGEYYLDPVAGAVVIPWLDSVLIESTDWQVVA